MKNLLKILSISAITLATSVAFAEEAGVEDGSTETVTETDTSYRYIGSAVTISDVDSVSASLGSSSIEDYETVSLQGHALQIGSGSNFTVTINNADTDPDTDDTLYLSSGDDTLPTDTYSGVLLVKGKLVLNSDVSITNSVDTAYALVTGYYGQLTVNAGVTLTLSAGVTDGVTSGNGDFYMQNKSQSSVSNYGTINAGTLYFQGGANATTFTNYSTGTLNLSAMTFLTGTTTKTVSFDNYGKLNITGATTVNANSSLTFYDGSDSTFGGALSITCGGYSVTVDFQDGSSSIFNGAVTINDGTGTGITTVNFNGESTFNNSLTITNGTVSIAGDLTANSAASIAGGTVTLNSGADVSFKNSLTLSGGVLTINDGASLSVDNLLATASGSSIVISAYSDGILQLTSLADEVFLVVFADDSTVVSTTITIDGYDISLSADVGDLEGDSFIFDSTGSMSFGFATVVPEPSTYAMIFGAIALGLAAYRRRK